LSQAIEPQWTPMKLGRFGASMDVDGDTLAIGAPGTGDPSMTPAVVLFERDPLGAWAEVARLTSPIPSPAAFGLWLDLEADRLVVGFVMGPMNVPGVVVYERDEFGVWTSGTVVNGPPGSGVGFFGTSGQLRGDDLFAATRTGLAVYRRVTAEDWRIAYEVEAPGQTTIGTATSWDSVALDGDNVIAGAPTLDVCAFGTARRGAIMRLDVEPLMRGDALVSIGANGGQDLFVDFGLAGAGKWHFVLGSLDGPTTGLSLPGGAILPLSFDAYTQLTLEHPSATLTNAWGQLDALGRSDVRFQVPPGLDSSFAGLVLRHAAAVLDPITGVVEASNSVSLELVP